MGALKEIGGELSIDGIYEVFKSMDKIESDGALDRSELKLFLENLSYASNVESAEDEHVDSNMIFTRYATSYLQATTQVQSIVHHDLQVVYFIHSIYVYQQTGSKIKTG